MKICIYGAGAVGGSLAVRLSRAGADISVIARGDHGRAIRQSGLTLLAGEDRVHAKVPCVENPAELKPQDVIVVTVKAPDLPGIADSLRHLLTPATRVVFAMNGIPWWFGARLAVFLPDAVFEPLDPGGRLRRAIGIDQIVGGVVYSSNEVVEPGVIRNSSPQRNRVILGKPNGAADPVANAMVDLLRRAGYAAAETSAVRQEIWIKMLLVVGPSPVSALTGRNLQDLVNDARSRALMATLMREGTAIGRRLGFAMPDDIDERLEFYRDKPVRPSLLQDFEAGRATELDSGILTFIAIANALAIEVPAMDNVATLLRLNDQSPRITVRR